jgi:hypothetical protein
MRRGTWRQAGRSTSSGVARPGITTTSRSALPHMDSRRSASGSTRKLLVVGGGIAQPATEKALATHHQTWARDRDTGSWRIDVLREPWEGDVWVCRRDPGIRLPAASLIAWTSDGIPYAQPEVVLLFKAKSPRPKDEADFAALLPLLDAERRAWLAEALARLHPRHPWLDALGAG